MVFDRYYDSARAYRSPSAARIRRKSALQGACSEPLDARLRATYRNIINYLPEGEQAPFTRRRGQALTNLKHGRVLLGYAANSSDAKEYIARTIANALGYRQEMSCLAHYQPPDDLAKSLEVVVNRLSS